MAQITLLMIPIFVGIMNINIAFARPTEDNPLMHTILTRLNRVEQENEKLHTTVSDLTKTVADLQQSKHSSAKGFLAIPFNDEEYERNDQVFFGHELFNPGNGYNDASSTYTCPVGGYYWFSVTVLCQSRIGLSDQMFGSIYINNNSQLRATAKGRETNNQGNNSGVMYCNAGDAVRVMAETTSSGTFGMVGSNESSFSGFLLSEGPA